MKFIRKSLISKAIFFFTLLLGSIVTSGIILVRRQVENIPLMLFFGYLIGFLVVIFFAFILDVVIPLRRVATEIRHLLTGENYKKVNPTTIDEVGMMTHFFNEITTDLEKISYDLKERRRMSSELDIASQIQKDVLPKQAPEAQGLDIVAKNRPAAEIGGDMFDFLLSADKKQVFLYIGDVTGHGVPAGLVMMMVSMLMRSMVTLGMNTSKDIIIKTNELLTPRISSRIFMTSVLLRWDKTNQKMYYTGAGHEHILIHRAKTEKVEAIPSGGIALGMIPDNSNIVQEKEIPLEIGDSIVLYSDGITEAKNQEGQMYGLDHLIRALEKNGFKPTAEGVFDSLTKDFANFVGPYVQTDDITMIVIKYMGPEAGSHQIKLAFGSDENKKPSKIWDWNA